MLIGAVCCDPFYLPLASQSGDLKVMAEALASGSDVVSANDSGTALRLLTAYFATLPTPHVLTGTERLAQRPIKPLVEALRLLGAEVSEVWPLRVCGPLKGNRTVIDASQSSQFLTALMLIAPTLADGLTIEVAGEMTSAPYVRLTEAVMRDCGAEVKHEGNCIVVPHAEYRLTHREVEADWSAAAFFYEAVALQPGLQLLLRGLRSDSWQGDAVVGEWFELLGVTTEFCAEGALLKGVAEMRAENAKPLTVDFRDYPDLFMAMAATACAKRRAFRFTGLSNLQHKESRRLTAMQTALRQLGFQMETDVAGGVMCFDGMRRDVQTEIIVDGCNDHRVVMALAPLRGLIPFRISGEDAVAKSFPDFFRQLSKTM